MADDQSERVFKFENFQLDARRQVLVNVGEGRTVNLTAKALQILLLLVENRGKVVSKNDLMTRVWQDTFVEEGNLTQTISILRKALGESPSEHRFIVTESGRGYRFVAPVIELNGSSAAPVRHSEADTKSKRPGFMVALLLLAVATVIAIAYYAINRSGPAVAPVSTHDIKAVAVLPFRGVETDDENKAMGIGMADAVIARLSRIDGIAVRQTSSVFRYADSTPEAVRIGREINVDAVLEGSIQKADGRIRVSVRLFRVGDGSLIWASSFDEREADIFVIQDAISQRVVSSLALQIAGDDHERLKPRFTENVEAYHLYNKGRYFWNRRTSADLRKSIEFYQQALAKDPNYALAYAGLAESYVLLHIFGEAHETNSFPRAREAAEKALSIDKDLAEAHAALGLYREQYEWDWDEAELEFKKALSANPSYATGHQWYGEFLAFRGRINESIAEIDKAVELDPLSLSTNTARGFPYLADRRYAEALERIQPALELDRDFPQALYYMARGYEGVGQYDKAIATYERAIEVSGNSSFYVSAMIYSLVKNRKPEAARRTFDRILAMERSKAISKYVIARSLAALGEKEKALDALEQAFEQRDGLMTVLRIDPNFDDMHDDPRFRELVGRLGL